MTQKPNPRRVAIYASSGMAIGAAIGLLFGLMLIEGGMVFPVAGAVFGAVIGMIWGL
jgi:hypothetical protein